MPRPWVDCEDGVACSCGFQNTIRCDPEKGFDKPVAVCFGHTPAEGAMFDLLPEAPDDFAEIVSEGSVLIDELDTTVMESEDFSDEEWLAWQRKFAEFAQRRLIGNVYPDRKVGKG